MSHVEHLHGFRLDQGDPKLAVSFNHGKLKGALTMNNTKLLAIRCNNSEEDLTLTVCIANQILNQSLTQPQHTPMFRGIFPRTPEDFRRRVRFESLNFVCEEYYGDGDLINPSTNQLRSARTSMVYPVITEADFASPTNNEEHDNEDPNSHVITTIEGDVDPKTTAATGAPTNPPTQPQGKGPNHHILQIHPDSIPEFIPAKKTPSTNPAPKQLPPPPPPTSSTTHQQQLTPPGGLGVPPSRVNLDCRKCGQSGHTAFGVGNENCPLKGYLLATETCNRCGLGSHYNTTCPNTPHIAPPGFVHSAFSQTPATYYMPRTQVIPIPANNHTAPTRFPHPWLQQPTRWPQTTPPPTPPSQQQQQQPLPTLTKISHATLARPNPTLIRKLEKLRPKI